MNKNSKELLNNKKVEIINYIKNDKKMKALLPIVIVLIIVLIIVMNLSYNLYPTANNTLKKYFTGLKEYDTKKVKETFYPQYISSIEDYYKTDYSNILKDIFNNYEKENYEIKKYKIKSYDNYTGDKKNIFIKKMNDYKVKEDLIDEIREYTVLITKTDNGKRFTEEENIILAKIDKHWYIFAGV